MKKVLLGFCGLLLATVAFGRGKGDDAFIFFDKSDTLYIQVIDHVGMGNSWKSIGERDRFYNFQKTLEEVFEQTDFPLKYEVVRFGANRLPQDQPRLDVTILKWGDDGMSQIEARFMAQLKKRYDRNKLGVFMYRGGSAYGFSGSERLRRVYNDVLSKALVKMVRELDEHLPVAEIEEEDADEEEETPVEDPSAE